MDDTQIIQWTIIGSAVAIVPVMIGLGGIGVWVLKTAMNSVRFELKGDIAELKTELKGDIAELKTELKGDIAGLQSQIASNRNEIITNRRMLGRFALHRHGDDGLPLAPLTDALEPLDGNDPQDNDNGSD